MEITRYAPTEGGELSKIFAEYNAYVDYGAIKPELSQFCDIDDLKPNEEVLIAEKKRKKDSREPREFYGLAFYSSIHPESSEEAAAFLKQQFFDGLEGSLGRSRGEFRRLGEVQKAVHRFARCSLPSEFGQHLVFHSFFHCRLFVIGIVVRTLTGPWHSV